MRVSRASAYVAPAARAASTARCASACAEAGSIRSACVAQCDVPADVPAADARDLDRVVAMALRTLDDVPVLMVDATTIAYVCCFSQSRRFHPRVSDEFMGDQLTGVTQRMPLALRLPALKLLLSVPWTTFR